jgi:short-subunit dehydrogenase
MNAIVTGASRGIGPHIARLLAKEGMAIALAARSQGELDRVAAGMTAAGARVIAIAADVADAGQLEHVVRETENQLGSIDVLVNNAGIETVSPFHVLDLGQMRKIIEVNLIGAMTLTRLVLPGMVERDRGWIVNVSSLAGKAGPPLAEAYAASKAGLIGFTQSLRNSYDGTGVHASVICPGFISGEGMFVDRSEPAGVTAPRAIGTSSPEQVAEAVLRAIRTDVPEILVTPGPGRLIAALSQLFPRIPGWIVRRTHLRDLYQKMLTP